VPAVAQIAPNRDLSPSGDGGPALGWRRGSTGWFIGPGRRCGCLGRRSPDVPSKLWR